MKNLFLTISLILGLTGASQSGWDIKMNGRLLLNIPPETETAVVKKITRTEWYKNGSLEIKYHNTEKNPWKRSFSLTDEKDKEVYSAENTSYVKLSLARLRKLYKGKKQLRIYAIIAPPNPDMGAPIRRIHLCTLRLP
jgi:hypothetical protein